MTQRRRTPLGDAIIALRQRAGMSQRELSDVSRVERSYISMLETGARKNASYEVLAALAAALGVTTAELYRRAGLPAMEPLDDAGVLRVNDPEKLPPLRRLSAHPADVLERAERMVRIWLLESTPPPHDDPQNEQQRKAEQDHSHPDL
jgi:transcriptional regulator with XRE-family HTH domain